MSSLPLRMLARDWRAGELRVLALALFVAVTAISSVGFFADRVKQALTREAHQLLGGDLLLVADHPWSDRFRDEARARGLATAETTTLISMARSGEQSQLVGVKAVSDGYPLRGRLRTAAAPNAPDAETREVPRPGTVWVDERLTAALGVKAGDSLELGDSTLTVAAVLTLEPDRGVQFFNIAPRVLMNRADLAATGLVQPGSRLSYALAVAGERKTVDAFEAWAKANLGRGESIQGLAGARPEIRQALDRAQQFLGLTAMLAAILAAVAIGLSTRRYSERHLDGYAVMRCLGASQRQLFALFAWEFVALAAAACAAGVLAGLAAQEVLARVASELIAAALPAPSLAPAAQGFAAGFVLVLGFALPPLMQLRNVPAIRVIRREVGPPRQGAVGGYALGLAAAAALLVWQAGDLKLGLYVMGGFAAAFVAFAGAAFLALRAFASAAPLAGPSWRYGLANLRRRSRANTVQILALALGLTAILLLTFTRADLIGAWRAKTPADAPNRFVLNIQPDQREAVLAFFAANGLPVPHVYPMVRGRLVAINDKPVRVDDYESERTRRLVEREFNLSYMADLPGHNRVVAGRWFDANDLARGALSVEQGIAQTLGIRIGDRLTWEVGAQRFSAPVTDLRGLDWDSMRVNFFVIATPKLLEGFPASFITSFNLPESRAAAMNRLVAAFPNLTVVDMSAVLRQALSIMDQVIRAVQFVFLFALAAGLLVLYAALLATQDERVQEAAVMRALGASRAQVAAASRAEFLSLGFLAGLLAAAGAVAIGHVLAAGVFQFPYHPDPWIWLAGPALGLAAVGLNAWAGTRAALARPPIAALREA
ncbi:MAG: FtsX-like permease family protein [Burkholderiales bacterium]|nr:FtsX-like permease family protein [Burkholderiales bacterium]